MSLERVCAMLESCGKAPQVFPPTLLYNEGWLLRLVLDWFASHPVPGHPLAFPDSGRWYSEAELPSAFLARYRGDPLAETWTHADGVIGHFEIGKAGKGALSLLPEASDLVVCEAKMYSGLAGGVKGARYYDQAARTVACVAETLRRAGREACLMARLGFYVLAPTETIHKKGLAEIAAKDPIFSKVKERVQWYKGEKDAWFAEHFEPTLKKIDIQMLSWEGVLEAIAGSDPDAGASLAEFYDRCKMFGTTRAMPG